MKHLYNTKSKEMTMGLEERMEILYGHFAFEVSGDCTLVLSDNSNSGTFVLIEPTRYTKIEKIVAKGDGGRINEISSDVTRGEGQNIRISVGNYSYCIRGS